MSNGVAERDYSEHSYGATDAGFGVRPDGVVTEYQKAFTDPKYPLRGTRLVMRGLKNTSRLLQLAQQ
ncbi:MAG: hypothetical protein ACLQME_18030 [Alphaproteobacteria bacterium]